MKCCSWILVAALVSCSVLTLGEASTEQNLILVPDHKIFQCIMGRKCVFPDVSGSGFSAGDTVSVLSYSTECSSLESLDRDDLFGQVVATRTDETELIFQSGEHRFLSGVGIYRACQCRKWKADKCRTVIDLGIVHVKGPLIQSDVTIGDNLSINVNGIGLSPVDTAMLLLECGQEPTKHSIGMASCEGQLCHFGAITLEKARADDYQLCWCQPQQGLPCNESSQFNTFFGMVRFLCPAGKQRNPDTGLCQDCKVGRYQPAASQGFCKPCGPEAIYVTENAGSKTFDKCLCRPGYFMRQTSECSPCAEWNEFFGIAYYCPGNRSMGGELARSGPVKCPAHSVLSASNSQNPSQIADCVCEAGYEMQYNPSSPGRAHECAPCGVGKFKAGSNNELCISCDEVFANSTTSGTASNSSDSCRCPTSTYRVTAKCVTCTVGFYCPGEVGDGHGDKVLCPYGSTTMDSGARSLEECLCDFGHFRADEECHECKSGRYKSHIGNYFECPDVCPSHAQCDNSSGRSEFDVSAVQCNIKLEGVRRPSSTFDSIILAKKLAREVAKTFGTPDFEISRCEYISGHSKPYVILVECEDIDVELDFTESEIRGPLLGALYAAIHKRVCAMLTVRRPTVEKAQVAAEGFHPEELTSRLLLLRDTLFDGLHEVSQEAMPVVTQVKTKCPYLKALPAGAVFVSVFKSCKCQAGYAPSDEMPQTCTACPANTWKSTAGNHACTLCPALRQTVSSHGANTSASCVCSAGYASVISGKCGKCGEGVYCPFDGQDAAASCPPGTKNATSQLPFMDLGPLRESLDDCMCLNELVDFRQIQTSPGSDYAVSPCFCPNNHYVFQGKCLPCGETCMISTGSCLTTWLQCQYQRPLDVWELRFVHRIIAIRNLSHSCGVDALGWTAACVYKNGLSGILVDYATHKLPPTAAGYFATKVSRAGLHLKSMKGGQSVSASTEMEQVNGSGQWWPPGLDELKHIDDLSLEDVDQLKVLYDQYNIREHIVQCASTDTCLGNNECAEGREGHACGRCKRGWSGGPKGACTPCDETFPIPGIVPYGLLLLALIGFFQMNFARHTVIGDSVSSGMIGAISTCAQSIQLCLRYCQTMGMAVHFDFSLPAVNVSIWNLFTFLSFDLASVFKIGCLVGNDFKWLAVLRLCIPWLLLVAVFIAWVISNFVAMLFEALGPICLSERKPLLRVDARQLPIAYASVFFLCFLPMLQQLASFFVCKRMPDQSFVVLDRRDVHCGFPFASGMSTQWNDLAPFAFVAMVAFVIFSYLFLVLFIFRGVLRGKDVVLRDFRSQYIHYRKAAYWWLIVTISKELLYALTGIIFADNGYWQALWSVTILVIYALMVYSWSPFAAEYLNYQEVSLQLFAVIQIMLAGLSGFGGQLTDEERQMKSSTLLVVQVAGLIVMCLCLLLDIIFIACAFCPRARGFYARFVAVVRRCKLKLLGKLSSTSEARDLALIADLWTTITVKAFRTTLPGASFQEKMHAVHRWIVQSSQLLDRHEQKQLFNGMILLFAVADAPSRILSSEVQKNLGNKALRRFTIQKAVSEGNQLHRTPLQAAQEVVRERGSDSLYLPTELSHFEDHDLYEELHLIHMSSSEAMATCDKSDASPESQADCTGREGEEEGDETFDIQHVEIVCEKMEQPHTGHVKCRTSTISSSEKHASPHAAAVRSLPRAPALLPVSALAAPQVQSPIKVQSGVTTSRQSASSCVAPHAPFPVCSASATPRFGLSSERAVDRDAFSLRRWNEQESGDEEIGHVSAQQGSLAMVFEDDDDDDVPSQTEVFLPL